MIKSFRFLLQFAWINLATILGFAAIVTLGSYATGVPQGTENIFRTYYGSFPMMCLIILFIYAFALCTSNLNLALSFGARRRDFFWAIQAILLVYTGVCWALQMVMSAIPTLFGWISLERWNTMLSLGGQPLWLYPLFCLFILGLGCLCGLVFTRSKVWGTVLLIAAMLLAIAGTVVLMLSADFGSGRWGQLPLFLAIGLIAVFAVCDGLIGRTVRRFMVR